jgi:hypothetical protein
MLSEVLDLHGVASPRIIDLTYSKGSMYGRLAIRQHVIKCDAEPYPGLDHQVAWQDAPARIKRASFDMVIIDSIQVDDQGNGYHGIYVSQKYPIAGGACPVADQFPSMFETAAYLLKPRTGTGLFKMSDGVHGNHLHPHGYMLVRHALGHDRAADDAEAPPAHIWMFCQRIPVMNQRGEKKPDRRTIVQHHLPNQIAEWYVCRLDGTCVGPGRRRRYEKRCIVADCRRPFTSRRSDAEVCSNRCQKKLAS